MSTTLLLITFLITLSLHFQSSLTLSSLTSSSNSHKLHDIIPLYSSILGPHHNPQETYPYDWLPVCAAETRQVKKSSLGESLQGVELVKLPIEIRFRGRCSETTFKHTGGGSQRGLIHISVEGDKAAVCIISHATDWIGEYSPDVALWDNFLLYIIDYFTSYL